MTTVLFALSLLLAVVVAQLASGPTALMFTDVLSGANVPAKTYTSCKFFSLVPSPSNKTVQLLVKLYWTVNGSNYDVQIEAPWTFKQGWLAIATSPSTAEAPMFGATHIISWIDENSGEAVMATMTSTEEDYPMYTAVTFSGGKVGATNNDALFAISMSLPKATWGGARNLLFASRATGFNVAQKPTSGTTLSGMRHSSRLNTADFNFDTPSPTCTLPAATTSTTTTTTATSSSTTTTTTTGGGGAPTPMPTTGGIVDDCMAKPSGALVIPMKGTQFPSAGRLEWRHDCAKQTTTFVFSSFVEAGTGPCWVGLGLVANLDENAAMSNADIYQFGLSAAAAVTFKNRHGPNGENEQPIDNVKSAIVGTPTMTRVGTTVNVTFVRQWASSGDATSPTLTDKFGKFRVLVSRHGTSNDLDTLHTRKMLLPDAVELFPPTAPTTTASMTTVATMATTTVAVSADDNPCPRDGAVFNNTIAGLKLGNDPLLVSYRVVCGSNITFTINGTSSGWLAIGFNDAAKMPNADVYQFAFDGSSGKLTFRNGRADGKDVVADDSAESSIIGTPTGIRSGSRMIITFTRKLVATNVVNDRTLSASAPLYFLYARSGSNDFAEKHTPEKSVSSKPVQLFTLKSSELSSTTVDPAIILVHGAFMAIAWTAAAPIGTFFARHLKSLGPFWFSTHRAVLMTVVLLTVVGFFLAIGYKANNLSSHFTTGHEILGLIIFLLTLVEPTLGFLADKWWTPTRTGTPIFPDIVHHWIGRVLITTGCINVVIGFAQFKFGTTPGFPAASIIITIWLVCVVGFTIAGQVMVGSAHDVDDSLKSRVNVFRNIAFGLLVPGIVVAIVAVVVAKVTYT